MKKCFSFMLFCLFTIFFVSCNNGDGEADCEDFASNPSEPGSQIAIAEGLAVPEFPRTYTELNCGEVLQRGIYNNVWLERDYNYRTYFLDYLYYQDFQTKEDVINSGYSATIPMPELGGALVDAARNFDYRRYREWRSSYEVKNERETVIKDGVRLMQQKIDEGVISAWIKCKTLQASQSYRGMFSVIQPIDENYAELTVFYIPDGVTGVSKAEFSEDVKVVGGIASCINYDEFKAGKFVETRTKKLRLKRKPDELLSVEMYFKENAKDTILYLQPPPVGTLVDFRVKENKTYIGDSVTLIWDVVNSKKVTVDGRRRNGGDSMKVKVAEHSQHVLTYEYKRDSTITDTVHIIGTIKPPTLVNANMLFITPMWADGKNNDNSHVDVDVILTDVNGKQIIGKGSFRDGTEIAPNQELTMQINFNANQASDFEIGNLKNVLYTIRFIKPDGRFYRNDQWTFRSELSLNFTKGKTLYCGYNEPAQPINFGPEWRPISTNMDVSRLGFQGTLIRPYL